VGYFFSFQLSIGLLENPLSRPKKLVSRPTDDCWALGTNGQGGKGVPNGRGNFFAWAAQRMERGKKESTYGV